jgi:hypothetical protein
MVRFDLASMLVSHHVKGTEVLVDPFTEYPRVGFNMVMIGSD